ncbi:class I SAM-dependent methyltransferase [Pseudomonadales bacterium]|nr:class I SAM-dependent methyltransferase [Pseudomonadales bacterium]
MSEMQKKYSDFYLKKVGRYLWPTEFVVRALLGKTYKFNETSSKGAALDLGFGDGRNLQLLASLYSSVYGLEISKEICDAAISKFPEVKYLNGYSHNIPVKNDSFDLVLAAHSIYYCDFGGIEENFSEVSRVIKSGGRFIFSMPKKNSYLIHNAELLDGSYARVKKDPLNLRNNSLLKYCESVEDLERLLAAAGFENISVGSAENDWWGVREFCWIVSCNKSSHSE